jgi:hypothetical protein
MDQRLIVKIPYIWNGAEDDYLNNKNRIARVSLTFAHADFVAAHLSSEEARGFSKELLKKLQPIADKRFGKMVVLTNDGVKAGSITITCGLMLAVKAALIKGTTAANAAAFAKDATAIITVHGIYSFFKDYKQLREGVLAFVKDVEANAVALYKVAVSAYSRLKGVRNQQQNIQPQRN